ncbi:hypothetical protein [Streptomyces sp. NPDC048256]|uniref:hypothetical protein n=1 Tax=Streptomyces sp. NPDC048256 TaxID=3154613 RepID=UPI0033CA3835
MRDLVFPDDHSTADLGAALARIPEQLEQGFTTFCVKPDQFLPSSGGTLRKGLTCT